MSPTETMPPEPDEAETRYDLAGNPLPLLPRAAAPAPPPGIHYAAAPTDAPSFAPPPGTVQPIFTPPPPGGFTPPPGAYSAPPGSAYTPAAKSASGPGLYFGLGGGLILLLGLIFGLGALKAKPVLAPASYKTYTAIDNSFTCDQPAGWTLHETGATNGNLATATFEDGKARVRVISDATGSLISDTMGASNANLPPEQQVAPVEKLHKMDQKQLADSLEGYDEKAMQTFTSALGEARVSEWTAAGDRHGYRATMLGREREFTVICFCAERDWKTLKPAFQRMIQSIKPGPPS